MPLSFDEIARTFDGQRGLPSEALRAFVTFVDEFAQDRVLDIVEPGIGTGRIALPLAAAGHRIAGVDTSRPMLDACTAKATALEIVDCVTLAEGDATDLPYDDDAFDVGLFASLLYLVPDWESVLDEFARVVRPAGAVIQIRERTETGERLSKWDAAWRTRVEAAGFVHQSTSPTDDTVLVAMRRRWPDIGIHRLASWSFGQTVGEGRDGYGDRLRSLYPDIPDAVWESTVEDFLRWSEGAFPDPHDRLEGRVVLEAVTAWT
ncbi:MAG TPA: class I SAM-dependent methyltransferase [Thermomicrobiales bacterium]|nr:class I SAM-dependent methyltransferase [Thermomicrobiales bacterium]